MPARHRSGDRRARMYRKKTYSAGRRTGYAVPFRCLQLSSNFLKADMNLSTTLKAGPEILQHCDSSNSQWVQLVAGKSAGRGLCDVGRRSGDQPGGKFGQQTRIACKSEIAIREA